MLLSNLVFHIPTRPYSPIDALNRQTQHLNSEMYEQNSNYNGNNVIVSWNEEKHYTTEYNSNKKVTIALGTFETCLQAALEEYDRGMLGSSVSIFPKADDAEAVVFCRQYARIIEGKELYKTWWTWRHDCAVEAAIDYSSPDSITMIFNWPMIQKCNSRKEYTEALKSKYGKVYR